MTRYEAPPPDEPGCGMHLAIPALFGGVIGLIADWLLWRWVTRPFRT